MKYVIIAFSAAMLISACTKTPSGSGGGGGSHSAFVCICSYENTNKISHHSDTFSYAASQDSASIYWDCTTAKLSQEQQISPFGTATCVEWR